MTDLHCTVCECVNNDQEYCCRPDILVSGKSACGSEQTSCADFQNRSESGNQAQNSCGCSIPNSSLHVRCEAENCTYNTQGECVANAIKVCGCNGSNASSKSETQCHTFQMR